jgi:nucleoside-diphosphate-sugar epimerase
MKNGLPVLPSTASIHEAIRRLEEISSPAAFVVDETQIFVGQVTIQQLRRLILSGADSASRIESYAAWHTAKLAKSELENEGALAALAEDMELQGIDAAPIVNKTGKVVGRLGLADIRDLLGRGRHPKARPAEPRTKNVLVVGGAGYLGSVLVRKLLQTGRRVRVLDSFIYGKRSLKPLEGHRSLEIIEGDFRNIETVVNSLKDIDAVVLLAAVVGDPAAQHRPEQTIETNILAAQSLAFACKLHCISRFLFASTCSVYGWTDGVLDEASPLNPVSLYARSKIFSEQCILDLAGDNFSPTILRMGTLYGYSPRMRFDLVVNTMSMKAHVEKRIQVFGGSQWRPLLHVEDAADAFARCLDAPLEKIGNLVFNVGSNEQNYRIIEIADLIGASLPKVKIEVEAAQLDARDYRVSFDKIRRALGFKAGETIPRAAKRIDRELSLGNLRNPYAKVYYNHYFDAAEES